MSSIWVVLNNGIPDATLFGGTRGEGTPIIIDTATGKGYFIDANGVVTLFGGTSGATVKTVLIGSVPYDSQNHQQVIADSDITPASNVIASWGAANDLDENTPEFDDVTFIAYPGIAGFLVIRLSCASSFDRLGGQYRLNYLIG